MCSVEMMKEKLKNKVEVDRIPFTEAEVDAKACFPLYETSSNRLQTAIATLARSDCEPHVRRYFTTVTNQLLSSGRSLVQLTIGE